MEDIKPKWDPLQDPVFVATELPSKYSQADEQPIISPKPSIKARMKGCYIKWMAQIKGWFEQLKEWFASNRKNKPQLLSVAAAALIFISGGMSMTWSLGNNRSIWWYYEEFYMSACWFVMAIIGVAVSVVLINKIKKKIFLLLSSALVLLSGILLLFLSLQDEYDGIMTALHLNGLAVGLLYVPFFIMAGEETVPELRGMMASSIGTLSFTLGVFLQSICGYSGILLIFLSALSLLVAYYLVIESPVYYLVRNQEQEAVECVRRLQCPFVEEDTFETRRELTALKQYVAYNMERSRGEAMRESLPALLKLSILYVISGISFSLVVSNKCSYGIGYATCRLIGTLVSVCLQDTIGRKKPLAIGMVASCAVSLGIAICFTFDMSEYDSAVLCLLYFHQLFAGLITASASSYLSEAFPLTVKPYCIAIVFTVEMLVQMLCATLLFDLLCPFSYVVGVMSLAYFGVIKYCLPETKKATLLDVQIMFQPWHKIQTSTRIYDTL